MEHARDSCQDGLHTALRSLLDMLERVAPSPDTLDALDDRVFAYSVYMELGMRAGAVLMWDWLDLAAYSMPGFCR